MPSIPKPLPDGIRTFDHDLKSESELSQNFVNPEGKLLKHLIIHADCKGAQIPHALCMY